MSRRDEREVARGLRQTPGGAPPADLLARLRADLPPRLAIDERAAARRRPAALGRRWLLAASLAAMAGAGLLSLRVMRDMREAPLPAARAMAPARLAGPRQGSAAGTSGAGERARSGGAVSSFVNPAPPARVVPSVVPPPTPGEDTRRREVLQGISAGRPEPAQDERWNASGEEVHRLSRPPLPAPKIESEAAPPQKPAPAGPPALGTPPAERPLAETVDLEDAPRAAPAPRASAARAKPARPAQLERKKEAAQQEGEPQRRAKLDALLGGLAASPTGAAGAVASPADGAPRLWAPEAAELAAAYDDDPPGRDGWALAAGGTPPPPKVAGRPVQGPPTGALWVRFRVRALDPALALAGARAEIAWSPGALRDRRLLGGGRETGEADVFFLSAGELRRGWTMVYEIRLAPAASLARERLAMLRLRTAEGTSLGELPLGAADLAPSWMDAPSTLRLPCLAAAFAERQALGAPEGYVDLVAAARSLAVARGRRDGRAATLLERIVLAERAHPAGQP